MNNQLLSLIFVFVLLGKLQLYPAFAFDFGQAESSVGEGFAVVELFTSEGCSSCPAADQYLRQITFEAHGKNQPIYTLGFHVDYWNYLGWVDRFSNINYTQRQHDYASKLKAKSVYTPQMIVNGRHAFGGSRKDLADDYIDDSLKQSAKTGIMLKVEKRDQQFSVDYSLSGEFEGQQINIALVEGNLKTDVLQGENAGRILQHANAVRAFHRDIIKESQGEISLAIPDDVNLKESAVIAFIQDSKTMAITGAVELILK